MKLSTQLLVLLLLFILAVFVLTRGLDFKQSKHEDKGVNVASLADDLVEEEFLSAMTVRVKLQEGKEIL